MNLKKLWKRKSVSITQYDPTYKVIYLGNVLTGWAKGDGCVEKPLATLWRNFCQSERPDIAMKVTICGAGLRAETEEHGLTEYWSHRITHCSDHATYPRIFCWVYRHEGRRLKQELRCHAVLCHKRGKAEIMTSQLKDRLTAALHEFRREKTIRQNARLSLVHALYDSAALPMRKVYLITGAANYRPPLERSKSAPKLGPIEEIVGEEEEDEAQELEDRLRGSDDRTATPIRTSSDAAINPNPFRGSNRRLIEPPIPFLTRKRLNLPNEDEPIALETSSQEILLENLNNSRLDENRERSGVLLNLSTPNLLFYPPDHQCSGGNSELYTRCGSEYTSPVSDCFRSNSIPESPPDQQILGKFSPSDHRGKFSSIPCSDHRDLDQFTSVPSSDRNRDLNRIISKSTSDHRDFDQFIPESTSDHQHRDLALLETLKDKNIEESLTSDQPESIASSSCSSSSCEGSTEENTDGVINIDGLLGNHDDVLLGNNHGSLLLGKHDDVIICKDTTKGSLEEEEDNISEESGYSEDKDCLETVRVRV